MWKIPVCDGCNRDNPTMIMIHDLLWRAVCETSVSSPIVSPIKRTGTILCFRCIEKRLGRRLTLYDLKDCPLSRTFVLGAYIYLHTDKIGLELDEDQIGFDPGY